MISRITGALASLMALAGVGYSFVAVSEPSERLLDTFAGTNQKEVDFSDAVDASRRRLTSAPLSAEAIYVLGLAAERRDDLVSAERLVERAVRLHPRMVAARLWLLRHAIGAGRASAALPHIAVLLRLNQNLAPAMIVLLVELARDRAMRSLVAQRFANTPHILDVVQGASQADFEAAEMLELLQGTDLRKLPSGIRSAQAAVTADLLRQERFAEARGAWLAILGLRASEHQIFDPNFAGADTAPPFGWAFTRNASIAAELVSSGLSDPGTALKVTAFGELGQSAAKQQLVLRAGNQSLRYRSRQSATSSTPPFRWRLKCVSGALIAELPIQGGSEWRTSQQGFTVPQACPSQIIELISRSGIEGQSPEVSVTGLAIES